MGSATDWQRLKKQQAFWENMADKYPRPFDAKSLADTERVIGLVEARGITIDNAAILDVACGTGIYSLPLARRAARVTGLDFSSGMLQRFDKIRSDHGITNADTIRASWQDADPRALGLEKGFDIAWASMTPAIRTLEDLKKMQCCARKWCVYIGWGLVRRNPLLERAFAAHGLTFGPPPGAAAVQGILHKQGIAAEMDCVDTSWEWQGNENEATEHVTGFIEAQSNIVADKSIIKKIIDDFSNNGKVSHLTEVEMGVLVWPSA